MFGWGRRAGRGAGASGASRAAGKRGWSARPPEVLAKVQRGELRKARSDKARYERLALAVHGRPVAVSLADPQDPGAMPFGAGASMPAPDVEGHERPQGGQS